MIGPSLVADLRWERWSTASDSEIGAILKNIVDAHAGALELVQAHVGDLGVAAFAHVPTGILFHLVPGGTFTMGMTDIEYGALQLEYQFFNDADAADHHLASARMRPATEIDLPAYLLAASPLGGQQIEWLLADPAARATMKKGKGKKGWDYPAVAKLDAAQYVRYLEQASSGEIENEQVALVEAALQTFGLRLPSDAEWERCARGGDDRPFPHGITIPRSPSTGENPFGFMNMSATTDVCADGFVPSLEGIPRDGTARPPSEHRVVRGGAGNCYPWQDCAEWTLMCCAWRGTMEGENGLLAIRPAMSL